MPRRATPRTHSGGRRGAGRTLQRRLSAGQPGGWQILGTTPLAMWDMGASSRRCCSRVFRVRFVDIAALSVAVRALNWSALQTKNMKPAAPAPARGRRWRCARPACSRCCKTWPARFGGAGRVGLNCAGPGRLPHGESAGGQPTRHGLPGTVNGGLRLMSHGDTVVAVTGADAPPLTSAGGLRTSVPRYQPLAWRMAICWPLASRCRHAPLCGGARRRRGPHPRQPGTDTLAHVGPPALAATGWTAPPWRGAR